MISQFRFLLLPAITAVAIFAATPAHAGAMPYETDLKKLEKELKDEAADRDKLPVEEAAPAAETKPEPLEADEKDMMAEPPKAEEPAMAEKKVEEPAEPKKTQLFSSLGSRAGYMGLSIGYFDANQGNKAVSFGAEWKPGIRIAKILEPMIGGLMTTDGNVFGYAGLGLPIKLGDKMMLTPSVALGALGGGNADLGQTLTYRIGGELAYLMDNGSRIGLTGQLITNGSSLHNSDRIDVIALTYTIPLGPTEGDSGKGM